MTLKVSGLDLRDLKEFNHPDRDSIMESAAFNIAHPEFRRMFSMKTESGYLVAVIGASYISQGVWEGWVFPCADVRKYAKRLVRETKDFSDWALTLDIHRLQIAVLEENRKWAESIGFQFESIVKNYHSKKDHFMYIKVGSHGG